MNRSKEKGHSAPCTAALILQKSDWLRQPKIACSTNWATDIFPAFRGLKHQRTVNFKFRNLEAGSNSRMKRA